MTQSYWTVSSKHHIVKWLHLSSKTLFFVFVHPFCFFSVRLVWFHTTDLTLWQFAVRSVVTVCGELRLMPAAWYCDNLWAQGKTHRSWPKGAKLTSPPPFSSPLKLICPHIFLPLLCFCICLFKCTCGCVWYQVVPHNNRITILSLFIVSHPVGWIKLCGRLFWRYIKKRVREIVAGRLSELLVG